MEVRNCKKCGRLFNYLGASTPWCPSCMQANEEKYEEVKKYIYDNPGANINVVSAEMDVSIPQLKQWVKEERLSFSEDSTVGVECERCGALIKTGRFCNDCKGKVMNEISRFGTKPRETVKKPDKKETNPKMRYFN